MKYTIVKMSELGDRWDAAFHIALSEVRDRVEQLRRNMSAEKAIQRLENLALRDKEPVLVLSRCGNPRLDDKTVSRAIREYPHLAVALVENHVPEAIQRIRERIARDEASIEALLELGAPADERSPMAAAGAPRSTAPSARFQAGFIYPLKNPQQYDDDLGTGYDHVAIAADASPGACTTHDVWVVNASGDVHPGYDACPIPLHISDAEVAEGRPLDRDLPEPKGILDSPWGR